MTRKRRGEGFAYTDHHGRPVRDSATVSRIRALAIPPAWTRVWICRDARGHIQATGRDARGRKQYRYHPAWRVARDEAKYHRFAQFCDALPRVRARVARDLACACLCKRKVVAAVVALMERAQLRVGNDEYARTNGSYGATTLTNRHARISGNTLELSYRGKSGVPRHIRITDKKLARIVRRCRDLPGQRLFEYVDGDSVRHVTSSDVNSYLRDVAGGEFTAKDYRTWAATIGAAMLLCAEETPATQRALKQCVKTAIAAVADHLGHTPAVCRASYIHPRLIEDFATGRLAKLQLTGDPTMHVDSLRAAEGAVARYLDR